MFSQCKNDVKGIQDARTLGAAETSHEIKIKRNLTASYAMQLQELSGKFRASQQKYLNRMLGALFAGLEGDVVCSPRFARS